MRKVTVVLMMAAALLGGSRLGAQNSPVQVGADGIRLDFQDADLRVVLSALAEAGGVNVLYTDLPARRITLRTNRPVKRENVLALMRSIAESNGLRLVEDSAFVRVEGVHGTAGRGDAPRADAAGSADLRLFVYRLKHARAPKLASTLQALFGGRAARGGASASPAASATLSQRLSAQKVPPVSEDATKVDVELGGIAPSLPGQVSGEVQIVPDESTNSLLVRTSPADWEVVRQAADLLDLRPLQVLIEVVIAEVRRTGELDVGISGKASQAPDATRALTATGELTGATDGDFTLSLSRVGNINVDLALSALASRGEVRILSRPVILAQNNQEARILIGSERPFVQVYRSLPTDAAYRDQVVQYRDVGTKLTITPTINPDGYVNLQLSQEISSATSELQFGAPVISTREATTHLLARHGQTVAIGGLVDHELERSRSGIPLLKDVPILGPLFGSTRSTRINSELFLFVTPYIVQSDEDADRVREQLQNRLDLLKKQVPAPLVPADTAQRQPGH